MEFTTLAQARKDTGFNYLGSVNKSAKLKKNGKILGQHTYGLYLAPASTSGYNVCSHSTPECRMGCLATSGHAGMEILAGKMTRIKDSRINKVKLFYENPEYFMAWLITEIRSAKNSAEKQGMGFSVRLNCTSDIDWKNVRVNGLNIFEIFPDVQFYDYTKNPNKFFNIANNYHLTFSYTGRNWNICKSLLEKGFNVAMVFNAKNEKEIPVMYNGYKVIYGDKTDYRVSDGKSVIVGLKWKHIANKEAEKQVLNSCFVVNVHQNTEVNVNELELATV